MSKKISLIAITVLLVHACLYAIDHSNLDENRPLRMEDPYPIARGEVALEAGVGYTSVRRNADRFFFPIEVLYGAYQGLQLEIGSRLSTEPRSIHEQERSGDLGLSALYNFNTETLSLPAFGLKTSVNLPTGVGSSGADVEIKGLITKSISRLSFNFNAAYAFLSGTERGEREGLYEVVIGASYPIGAPKYTRTTLLADVFTRQSDERGGSNIAGVEAGFRHQLTQRSVVDFGVGSELAGPAERSTFFVTAGMSIGF